jgi:hypothetical protein
MCSIRSQNLRFMHWLINIKRCKNLPNHQINHQTKASNQDSWYYSSQSLIEYFEAFFYLLDSLNKGFKYQNKFEQIKSKLQRDSDIKGLSTVFFK